MLFVLAARREAPVQLIRVNRRGVPAVAILSSTVVGFLCVIAAKVSPNTVFLFLLNSSGAIILFVYLLIAISQLVLRRRTPPERLRVKMWFHPVLSLLTVAGILAVLVQMGLTADVRSQLWLSLLSWAVVVGLYFVTKWRGGSVPVAAPETAAAGKARRVLVLANETVAADELLEELRRIDEARHAQYYVCVPANPVDTGQAKHKGAVFLWQATMEAAQRRLDYTLNTLRKDGLQADGALGDYRPLRALADAVASFRPDQLVISTLPLEQSTWLRYDVVDRARSSYDIPVTHVISHVPVSTLALTS
jgi:GABA permease